VTRSIDANVEVHPFVASDELVSGHSPYGVLTEDNVNKPPSEIAYERSGGRGIRTPPVPQGQYL
jgi:hypothetical protein